MSMVTTVVVWFLTLVVLNCNTCLAHDEDDNNKGLLTAHYMLPCQSACMSAPFYWCYTSKGWDYCAPALGYDHHGRRCTSNCTDDDDEYHWCDVETLPEDTRDGWGYCMSAPANTDECALETDDCDANAYCTDTDPGFTCHCKQGYRGDGKTCTAINACQYASCPANSRCETAGGSATCVCLKGTYIYQDRCLFNCPHGMFSRDGRTCQGYESEYLFRCANGTYIPRIDMYGKEADPRCNGVKNCGDNSDEKDCKDKWNSG